MLDNNQTCMQTAGQRNRLYSREFSRLGQGSFLQLSVVRAALALALFGMAARADVIFTNFGANNSNNSLPAIQVSATAGGYTAAQSFTPIQNYILGSVTLALSVPSGEAGASFTVAIMTDSVSNPGNPGTVIEQFTVTSLPISQTPVIPIVVNSVKNPTLTAYTQYWLAIAPIAPTDPNVGYWQTNTIGELAGHDPATLTVVSTSGLTGPWDTNPWFGNPRGAFAISGNPTTGSSAPAITSLVPATISAGTPAFTLTVNGTRFLTGATVQWNGAALTSTLVSDSQLTAAVPASLIASTGVASITVLNSNGDVSNAVNFTITAQPQFAITGLSPNFAVAGGAAFTMTIAGTNFAAGATVHFGASVLTPTSVTATQIQVTVPAALIAAVGTPSVTVVQSSTTSNALTFTIRSTAVTLSTLVPSSVVAGGPDLAILITGVGFTKDATVVFGATTLAPNSVTSTQIVVTIPAALIASIGTPSVFVTQATGVSNLVTFVIGVASGQPLAIATSPLLPLAKAGVAYSGALIGTGGTPPYSWALINNSTLPTGLSLAASGAITGTPTATGYFSIAAKVTDSASATATGNFVLNVTAAAPPGTITTAATLPPGTVGAAYSLTLTATGGTPPYVWTAPQSALPAGLSLSSNGVLAGTPTTTGSSSFTIQLTDSAQLSTTKDFTLVINAAVVTTTSVLSHFASGGGWDSSIYLVNTSASAVAVDVKFLADNGSALSLDMSTTLDGVTHTLTASELTETITPSATMLIDISSPGSAVSSSGWVQVTSGGLIKGYAAFHYISTAGVGSAGTVPLESVFAPSFLLPYDGTGGLQTGIALANLTATQPCTITATILNELGDQIGTGAIVLPANGHTSFMLGDKFPATITNRGIIRFSEASSTNITGLGLRVYPTGGFTSIPKLQ